MYHKNIKVYAVTHWFIHLLSAHLIAYFTNFSIIGYRINILNLNFPIFDYIIMYLDVGIIDLDHLLVIRKIDWKNISELARLRVPYPPLHNLPFLFILFFISITCLFLNFVNLFKILLAPISNLLFDLFEDLFVFKVGIKKWKWFSFVKRKELEIIFKENS